MGKYDLFNICVVLGECMFVCGCGSSSTYECDYECM